MTGYERRATSPREAHAAQQRLETNIGSERIQRRLDPGQPLDKDIYALTPAELKEVPNMPASLEEALDNVKKDHEYLLKGGVFTKDLIETYVDYKTTQEFKQVALRPHPYEFALYYDA